MALVKQPLAIQFSGGVETKIDSKQVPTTKLLDLLNATFVKASTLAKRNGYRALGRQVDGAGSPYSTASGLAGRGDELVLFADAQALSYRPSSDSWDPIQAVSSVIVNDVPVARTGTDQMAPDAAVNGGIEVVAWEDSRGGVWCSVVEQVSQRIIVPAVQLDASGERPRCVPCGGVLHIMWANGARIWLAIVNPAAPEATPVPIILTEDLTTNYDACPTFTVGFPSIQPSLVAWAVGGGYRVGYVHPSGALGSATTGLPAVATVATTRPVGVIAAAFRLAGAGNVIVAYGLASFGGAGYNFHSVASLTTIGATGSLTASATAIAGITAAFQNSTAVWWAIEITGASNDVHQVASGSVTTAGVVATGATVLGHMLASRAFNDNGDVYCAIVHPVLYFPYVAIVQLSAGMRAQSRVLPGLTTGALPHRHLPSAFLLNTTPTSRQHGIALGNRIQLAGSSGTQFGESGIRINTFDFDHEQAYQTSQLGRGLYLAGSLPQSYDGDRFAEADFHCAPDTATGAIVTAQTTGGSLTTTNAYLYKLLYEEIDGQGEIHPGAVSVGTLVTLSGSNDQITLTIPTYRLTSKRRVRISVFRSVGNATGTPTQIEFFRVSSVDPTQGAAAANGYLANDPTVDSVSFVDRMSDATAQTLEPLYTNGGILSNDPYPMSGGAVTGGKSRLYWTDPSDPNLVRYSQQLRDDTAVEASVALSVRVDPYGGGIVALGVMDDTVYAFKEGSVYGFAGPGPDADGGATSQNAWSPPQLVTSDVGCVDPNSICPSPLGIVFKSAKGFKLLGRDQQISDIGSSVYGLNAQSVTRATLLPDRHQIVFLTDSGFTLLWDYEYNQWSKYTNHEGYDAIVIGGSYYYLRTDGRVFVETPGLYKDDNQHIPMRIETAWIKFSNYLQGWQRVLYAMFIGQYESEHMFRVRYRIDYQDGYSAPIDNAVDMNYNPDNYGEGPYGAGPYGGAGGASTVYQRRIHINRRCQAISFRIEDIEATDSYGAAFELSELLLTGGVLGPMFQPGAARSQ